MARVTNKNYLSKHTVNLVMREHGKAHASRMIIASTIVIVLIMAFGKFGVIDLLNAVSEAEAEVARAQAELDRLVPLTADYDEVSQEHMRYSSAASVGALVSSADVMEVIGLVESELMRKTQVISVSYEGYVIKATLGGATLELLSDIVTSVKAHPLVESVEVFTANLTDSDTATTTLSITLTADEGGDNA